VSAKRIYRESDRIRAVELPEIPELGALSQALAAALASERRPAVERASRDLCQGIMGALGVPPAIVKVRTVRPSERGGELHGLYTWEPGKQPVIEVWMRTAQHKRVVAFRTFLRTLLHEVCHHLDFTLYGLSETFHTEGFFRRESSLVRQIAGTPTRARSDANGAGDKVRQLRLFS
jgi:hypothetical protein